MYMVTVPTTALSALECGMRSIAVDILKVALRLALELTEKAEASILQRLTLVYTHESVR